MFMDKKKLIKQTCNIWRRENFKLQLYLLQQDSLISVSEKYDKFMFVVRLSTKTEMAVLKQVQVDSSA